MSSLLEAALVHPQVDSAFLKRIYKLLPQHVSYVSPDLLLFKYNELDDALKARQIEKLKFMLDAGLRIDEVFPSGIWGTKRSGTIFELAKLYEADGVIEFLNSYTNAP